MNETRLLPDDPKLTAYALGELSGDERAAVEAALRENPALRVTVDEIRATAAHLEAALAHEPIFASPPLSVAKSDIVIELNGHSANGAAAKSAARKKSQLNGKHAPVVMTDEYQLPNPRAKLLRFPQFYYVVATAAAACFAVLVARYQPAPAPATTSAPSPRVVTREVALPPPDNSQPGQPERIEVVAAPAVEVPVITAPIPSASSELASVPVPSNENTRPENTAPLAPAFIDRNLSLISQTTRDPSAAAPGDGTTDRILFAVGTLRSSENEPVTKPELPSATAPFTVPLPSGTLSGKRPGEFKFYPSGERTLGDDLAPNVAIASNSLSGGTPAGGRAVAPLLLDTMAPPIAGPVVASATVPSLVPSQGAVSTSGGTVTMSTSGEVVVLSAFMVNADRAVGFAGVSSSSRTFASDKRKVARRDDLPSPPPGAKLGKNTEAYSYVRDNDFLTPAQNPLSTFAVDVDTASYANVRRILQHGTPPPRDAVRIEEMVNYFPYRYPAPRGDQPFAASLEVADAPWAAKHRLVRIGLKAREVTEAQRPAANLVFLLDVSGSMNQPNKLPLVRESLRLLVLKLKAEDRVAIVTYAGNSGLALPSTPAAQSREILNALDTLTPGGSTNGAMGIQLAYEIAKANFVPNGINRVILCTDGDFNVGPTSEGELVRLIEEKATSGVFLTVLGFGMGNYKDATLEKLADKGNGNYGYIDTRREAEKILVEQISSTLATVAKDVKIQVEFNPATVSSYRLIGYENRLLRKEDFNDDKVDAGEVGAGHAITVLYEIIPVGAERANDVPPVDELKYAVRGAVSSRLEMPSGKRDPLSNELLTVKVRYKKPDSLFSFTKPLEFPLLNTTMPFEKASADFRFAAAVAQFGMILRGSPHRGIANMGDVAAWAATAAATPADDPGGYRSEFLELVRKAQTMME